MSKGKLQASISLLLMYCLTMPCTRPLFRCAPSSLHSKAAGDGCRYILRSMNEDCVADCGENPKLRSD